MSWFKDPKKVIPILLLVVALAAGLFLWLRPDPVSELIFSVFQWEEGGSWENYLGVKALQENLLKQATMDLELKLDSKVPFLGAMGIEAHSTKDREQKKSSFELSMGLGGFKLMEMQSQQEGEQLTLTIPTMGHEVFGLLLDENLESNLQKAPLFQKMSEEQQKQTRALLINMRDQENGTTSGFKNLSSIAHLGKTWKDFRKSFQVAQAPEKAHRYQGKEIQLKGYDIKIPKKAAAAFAKEVLELLKDDKARGSLASLLGITKNHGIDAVLLFEKILQNAVVEWENAEGDITLLLHYQGKQALSVNLDLHQNGVNHALIHYYGGATREESMDLTVILEDPAIAQFSMALKKEVTLEDKIILTDIAFSNSAMQKELELAARLDQDKGELQANLTLLGEKEKPIRLKGRFEELVRGKSFTFKIDELGFGAEGERGARFTGTLNIKDSASGFSTQPPVDVDLLQVENLKILEIIEEFKERFLPSDPFSLGFFRSSYVII